MDSTGEGPVTACDRRRTLAAAFPWVISAVLIVAGLGYSARPAISMAEFCDLQPKQLAPRPATGPTHVTTVTVWADARVRTCWLTYMAVAAAPLVTNHAIQVEATPLVMEDTTAWQLMREAAAHGRAPDIVHIDVNALNDFMRAGYLIPLDSCIASHPEFTNIRPDVWRPAIFSGHVWGVPTEADVTALYFNKVALRKLGWSEARIEALPQHIQDGEWTFDDLRATAGEAIAKHIIAPGFGIWPIRAKDAQLYTLYLMGGGRAYDPVAGKPVINQRRLAEAIGLRRAMFRERLTAPFFEGVIGPVWNRNVARRDAFIGGRVLFFLDDATEWGNLLAKLPGASATRFLDELMGVALIPIAKQGQAARAGSFVSFNWFYALTSDTASSGRHHQAEACALLAKMTLPVLNDLHTSVNGSASVMTARSPSVPAARHGYDMGAMIDHAWPMPVQPPITGQTWAAYSGAFLETADHSEADTDSDSVLAGRMVDKLRQSLGDEVIVE